MHPHSRVMCVALPCVAPRGCCSSYQPPPHSRLCWQVYSTETIGTVRGHFGPVNAIAFSPDGRSFVTGGEDGYLRLNIFDADYFSL